MPTDHHDQATRPQDPAVFLPNGKKGSTSAFRELRLPRVQGSEGELAMDISRLRKEVGWVTLDPGYGNTASCQSAITFIDGERGLLHFRGYPIEQLAHNAAFLDVCHLMLSGKLPGEAERATFEEELAQNLKLPEHVSTLLEGFPQGSDPMAMLASAMAALPATRELEGLEQESLRLLAVSRTLAGNVIRRYQGRSIVEPDPKLSWAEDLLRMTRPEGARSSDSSRVLERALDLLLLLHADHEQNCSTSTMRMVASSDATVYAAAAAAVAALSGPRHGGANQAVVEMLEALEERGGDCRAFLQKVKDKQSNMRLMGFGHRVYRNFDPRAKVIKKEAQRCLEQLGVDDPLLELAQRLEESALEDEYFVERKLYPNVDFYSGILYRAMGLPSAVFPVLFAVGRLPGWLAHMAELKSETYRIQRPRQIYVGPTERSFPSRSAR